MKIVVTVKVREGLADGSAEDLDDPEVDRDFWDLAEHRLGDARPVHSRGAHACAFAEEVVWAESREAPGTQLEHESESPAPR